MLSKYFRLITLLSLVSPNPVFAKEFGLAQIYVNSDASDSVGRQVLYEYKEAIHRSGVMKIANTEEKAGYKVFFNSIELKTNATSGDGYSTVFSMNWTINFPQCSGLYWSSTVGYCGIDRVKDCAADLVSQTERVVSEFRKIIEKKE